MGAFRPPSAGPWAAQLERRARASQGLPGVLPDEVWFVTAGLPSGLPSRSPGVGLAVDGTEAARLPPGEQPARVWAEVSALSRGF